MCDNELRYALSQHIIAILACSRNLCLLVARVNTRFVKLPSPIVERRCGCGDARLVRSAKSVVIHGGISSRGREVMEENPGKIPSGSCEAVADSRCILNRR
jgi:hypothetical protein